MLPVSAPLAPADSYLFLKACAHDCRHGKATNKPSAKYRAPDTTPDGRSTSRGGRGGDPSASNKGAYKAAPSGAAPAAAAVGKGSGSRSARRGKAPVAASAGEEEIKPAAAAAAARAGGAGPSSPPPASPAPASPVSHPPAWEDSALGDDPTREWYDEDGSDSDEDSDLAAEEAERVKQLQLDVVRSQARARGLMMTTLVRRVLRIDDTVPRCVLPGAETLTFSAATVVVSSRPAEVCHLQGRLLRLRRMDNPGMVLLRLRCARSPLLRS